MGLGSILTGLAIYKSAVFGWLTWLCGGYAAARLDHFILTIGYCLFFIVHIVQVIAAGWNNFQAMITGFEVVKPAAVQTQSLPPPEPVEEPLPQQPQETPQPEVYEEA
jgi:hypothetical protein